MWSLPSDNKFQSQYPRTRTLNNNNKILSLLSYLKITLKFHSVLDQTKSWLDFTETTRKEKASKGIRANEHHIIINLQLPIKIYFQQNTNKKIAKRKMVEPLKKVVIINREKCRIKMNQNRNEITGQLKTSRISRDAVQTKSLVIPHSNIMQVHETRMWPNFFQTNTKLHKRALHPLKCFLPPNGCCSRN